MKAPAPTEVAYTTLLIWSPVASGAGQETASCLYREGDERSAQGIALSIDEAKAFARSLVKDRSPVSVALIRQLINRNASLETPWEAHLAESLAVFYTSQADGREGVRAFNEKRPAQFQGKASQMPPFFPWYNHS